MRRSLQRLQCVQSVLVTHHRVREGSLQRWDVFINLWLVERPHTYRPLQLGNRHTEVGQLLHLVLNQSDILGVLGWRLHVSQPVLLGCITTHRLPLGQNARHCWLFVIFLTTTRYDSRASYLEFF